MTSASSATSKNGFTLILSAVENSYSTAGNSSSVTVTLYLKAGGTYFQQYRCSGDITLGGTALKSYSQYYSLASSSDTVVLATHTFTAAHDNDGGKTLAFSGSFSCALGSYGAGSGLVSLSLTLTAIPRASALTGIVCIYAEDGFTPAITKKAAGYYHKLVISAGGTGIKTVTGIENGGSVSFTDAELLALYGAAAGGKSVSVSAELTTYTDAGMGVSVGTDSRSAALPLGGNIRLRTGGDWVRGRLFRRVGGEWKPCLILRKSGGLWGRGK